MSLNMFSLIRSIILLVLLLVCFCTGYFGVEVYLGPWLSPSNKHLLQKMPTPAQYIPILWKRFNQ